MNTRYYIQLTLRTPNGPEVYGKFFLGDNRSNAENIFRKLQGTDRVDDRNMMYLDFMGTSHGLPVALDMITCTLDQLGENCKLISKELFKLYSLSLM